MRINVYVLLIGVIVCFFFSMETQGNRSRDKKKRQPVSADSAKKLPPYGNVSTLIEAKKYEIIENSKKAEDTYREYIEKYPLDPVAYFELSRIVAENKDFNQAIGLAEKAVSLDPSNLWYRMFLSELYQQTGNYKEAIVLYEKIVREHPDDLDYYYQLAALYLMAERYSEAVSTYDKIENKAGISEDISVQKEKIFLHLNDLKKAQAEIERLINSDPQNTKYLSILAEFFMSNEMPEKAGAIYEKINKIDPGNPYIHMSLADYYRKTGNREKAFEELKLGFANPNLDIDTKVNILLSFYTVNQLYSDLREEALTLSKILIEAHPNDPKSHSIYGDLLLQDKKYTEAREEFLRVVTLDSSKYVVWEQVLRLDLQLEKYDHLVDYGKKAQELFPEQPIPYLFSGMGYYQQKKYEQAIKELNRGLKLVVNDDELSSQFFMYLGDTYHALKNPEESDKAYEKSLKFKGDNPYVLNNFSYYLSLRGKDLPRAEQMAKRAVTLEPGNASFQDTYGWVLFKLGKYEEAKTWISKALDDKDGVSAEVLEHYGDVIFKLGDTEKAIEYWNKAKIKGPGSDLLEKKISDKKLYE